MKKTSSHTRAALEKHFDRLRQNLARIGYISRGSVLERSVATSGRSGYQWTRKVAGKTVTVSLSQEQFEAMKQAVSNQGELRRTIVKRHDFTPVIKRNAPYIYEATKDWIWYKPAEDSPIKR